MMKATTLFTFVALSLWTVGTAHATDFLSQVVQNTTGVNLHPGNLEAGACEQDFMLLQQAGVGLVRGPFKQNEIVDSNGIYHWERVDNYLTWAAKYNMRINPVLCADGVYYQSYGEEFRNSFKTYCLNVVNHCVAKEAELKQLQDQYGLYPAAQRQITWELWNEPNIGPNCWTDDPTISAEEYKQLGMAVMPYVRLADPTCTLAGPALSDVNGLHVSAKAYLAECVTGTNSILNWADGVTIHPYHAESPEVNVNYSGSTNTACYYPDVRDLLAGSGAKVVCGECGYATVQDFFGVNITKQNQADYLARMNLVNLREGIPYTISYCYNSGTDPTYAEANFGIVNCDLSPKPAYYAIQALTNCLHNKTYSGQDTGSTGDWLLRFDGDGRCERVGWTTGTPSLRNITGWGKFYVNETPLYLGEIQNWKTTNGNWSSQNWDNSSDIHWVDGSQARFYTGSSTITVDTTAVVSGFQFDANNITLAYNSNGQFQMGLGGCAINTGSYSATINAPINNQALPCNPAVCQVRKSGTGTLTLGGDNRFTGNLMIYQGSVVANNSYALYGPVVTLLSTATNGGLSFGSGLTEFHIGGIAGNRSLNYGTRILDIGESGVSNDADGVGYSGVLSGSGAIRKYGAGTMLLSGANNISGAIDVYDGMLAVSNTNALNGGSSTITVHGGGIDVRGCTLSRQLVMDAAGITLANTTPNTTSTLTQSSFQLTNDITITAQGTLNLPGTYYANTFRTATKNGVGTLNLSGTADNAYLNLVVHEGAVQLSKENTDLNIHAAANVTVYPKSTVQYNGSGDSQVWRSGTINLNGGTVDFNGSSQVGTVLNVNAEGSTLANTTTNWAWSSYTPTSSSINKDFTASVSIATNTLWINGPLNAVPDYGNNYWPTLTKTGAGTLYLSGPADNANLTLSVTEGTIKLDKISSSSVHSAVAAGVSGGTLQYSDTGSGDYQLAQSGGWLKLCGGTVDFNGRNQLGTNLFVTAEGSTLANNASADGVWSIYTPTTSSIEKNFTVNVSNATNYLWIGGPLNAVPDYGNNYWPTLTKTGAGTLYLSTESCNTNLTLNVVGGTVRLDKVSTPDVYAAAAAAVQSGGTLQYSDTGSGDAQIRQDGWVNIYGGTMDFNGKDQNGTILQVMTAGSTLANYKAHSTSIYSPTNSSIAADFTVNTVGDLELAGGICSSDQSQVRIITKTGAGTLTLSGNTDNVSLGMNVQQGTVRLNKQSGADVHAIPSPGIVGIAPGALVLYTGSGEQQVWAGGYIMLTGGTLDFNGHNQIGTIFSNNTAGSTLANTSTSPSSFWPSSVTLNADLNVMNVGDLNINGNITGSRGLNKSGTGTLYLNGTNNSNWTGSSIVSAGNIQLQSVPGGTSSIRTTAGGAIIAAGAYSTVMGWLQNGHISTLSSGALALAADGTYSETINMGLYGHNSLSLGAVTNNCIYQGTITPANNAYRFGGGGGTLKVKSNLTNNGTTARTVYINGNVILDPTSQNTYSGATTVNSGNLKFASTLAISNNSSYAKTTVGSNGAVLVDGAYTTVTNWLNSSYGKLNTNSTGTLALIGNRSETINMGSYSNLSLGAANGDWTYSGSITPASNTYRFGGGGGTLTVSSSLSGTRSLVIGGKVAISGSKSYTGATSFTSDRTAGGVLTLNSNAVLTSTSGITLGAGTLYQNSTTALTRPITCNTSAGTLGGTGTYNTTIDMQTYGGHLSPGAMGLGDIGTMHLGTLADLYMGSNTVLDFDFSSSTSGLCDCIDLGGAGRSTFLDGILNITTSSGTIPVGTYTIITNIDPTYMTNNGIELGSLPLGHDWSVTFLTHNGLCDLAVVASPEPGTVVLLVGALLSLAGYAWWKRRS